METSVHYAIQELRKLEKHQLAINERDIIKLITAHGFSVIPYSMESPSKKELFKKLNVEEMAANHRGFSICSSYGNFVFYKQNLSAQDKKVVLGHELGHIALEHFAKGVILGKLGDLYDKNTQEKEANEFALYLLAPTCILKKCGIKTVEEIKRATWLDDMSAERVFGRLQRHEVYTNEEIELCKIYKSYITKTRKSLAWQKHAKTFATIKKILFIGLLAAAWIFTFIKGMPGSKEAERPQETPLRVYTPEVKQDVPLNTEPENGTETQERVYITRTGEKYHLKDCSRIKDKEIWEITLDEATQKGYTPCKVCIGK